MSWGRGIREGSGGCGKEPAGFLDFSCCRWYTRKTCHGAFPPNEEMEAVVVSVDVATAVGSLDEVGTGDSVDEDEPRAVLSCASEL